MRVTLTVFLVAVAVPAGFAESGCVQVSSDTIAVRDLLSAEPLLGGLDPDTPVGFAPFPGTRRTVSGWDLIGIARRRGVTLSGVPDVCVERALRVISPDEMRATLMAALGIPDAQIEVLEYSSQPLPPGRLEFRRSGLNQPPAAEPEAPVIWRGRLMYEDTKSLPAWAKVKITVDRPIFLAAENVPAGTIIGEAQVQAATVHEFPFPGPWLDSPAAIAGKVARRSIPAGQRFTANALDEAKDVARGDIVQVRVIDGSATLSFDGIAASSGRKGDTIVVHNSASGRNFRAVIEEKGKVVVRPTSGDE